MTACGQRLDPMWLPAWKPMFTPEDSSLPVSAWEEALLLSAMLISKPPKNSTTSKSSLSVPPESATRNGQSGLIALPHQPESTSEETPSPSFPDASLPSATTDKPETPLFAIPASRNADARTKNSKMNSKCSRLFPSYWLNSTSTRRRLLMENSEDFSITSTDTRKLKTILLSADLHILNHYDLFKNRPLYWATSRDLVGKVISRLFMASFLMIWLWVIIFSKNKRRMGCS